MGDFLCRLSKRVIRRRFDIGRRVDAACDPLNQSVGDETAKMLGVQPTRAHIADANKASFPHELQHLVAVGCIPFGVAPSKNYSYSCCAWRRVAAGRFAQRRL